MSGGLTFALTVLGAVVLVIVVAPWVVWLVESYWRWCLRRFGE